MSKATDVPTHQERLDADPDYDPEGEEMSCLRDELRHALREIEELRAL